MGRISPYTDEQKEELKRMKLAGATIEELMAHFNKSKKSIAVTLHYMGLHKKEIKRSNRITRKQLLKELHVELQKLIPERKVEFISEKLTRIEDMQLILEGVRRLG